VVPITPSFIVRLILLRLNRGPGLLLDFLGAQAFRTACVAVKLGVFEALTGGPSTGGEIARRIEADERGTTLLLEALVAIGYVKTRPHKTRVSCPCAAVDLLGRSFHGGHSGSTVPRSRPSLPHLPHVTAPDRFPHHSF